MVYLNVEANIENFYIRYKKEKRKIQIHPQLLLLLPKDKTHQEEVDRNGDGKDRHRSPNRRDAHGKKEAEQQHMQQIVHRMGTAKPEGLAPRGTAAESEVGRQVEVGHEGEQVAQSIGHMDHNHPL